MDLLPDDVDVLVSPFLGGGAIELAVGKKKNVKVIASDSFEPLVNCWQQIQKDGIVFNDSALEVYPLSFEERKHYFLNKMVKSCQDMNGQTLSDFDRAVKYWLVNRMSFIGSGLTQSPQKNVPEHCCNEENLRKFRPWYNDFVTVSHADYRETIEEYDGHFMYLDPPYPDTKGYGDRESCKLEFDHAELCERIGSLNNRWILSYNDHPLIRDLYDDFRIIEYNRPDLAGGNQKRVSELFITNF